MAARNYWVTHRALLRLALAAGALGSAWPAGGSDVQAATWTVSADGTGDFATITEAVGGADEGDVIELTPGTFTGAGNRNIDFGGRNLTLRAANGDAGSTVLDAEGTAVDPRRVFLFTGGEGASTRIEDLTIRGGLAAAGDGGGGVRIAGSSPVFARCRFEGNAVADKGTGGAVFVDGAGTPRFEDCVFALNTARQGGALAFLDGSSARFTDCVFDENSAAFDGGAIFALDSLVEVARTLFLSNTAPFGGAVFLDNDAEFAADGATFHDNVAGLIGGAITVSASTARITGSTFAANAANSFDFMGGGALWCSFGSTLEITDTLIAFNTFGQAVVCEAASTVTVSCSNLHGNAGGDWTGELAGLADQAGNLSTDPFFCSIEMRDFSVAANSPALPGFNSCGVQMGAEGAGCDVVPVHERTWGRIKSDFR